jgi:DnaA-homolog protein
VTAEPAASGIARTRHRQLVLAFPLGSRCRFENFVIGANPEAVQALVGLGAAPGHFRGCLLVGALGTGKTHLLQSACHLHGRLTGGAIYLPLRDATLDPAALEGLEQCALVALDDVDAWLGDPERERALLALYQGLLAQGGALLAATTRGPAGLEARYPDLLSRLRALPVYTLQPLDDAGKATVLRRLAGERGLALEQAVLDYWLSRGARDLATLIAQFEALDAAAMAERRRVTVPLLKAVLDL